MEPSSDSNLSDYLRIEHEVSDLEKPHAVSVGVLMAFSLVTCHQPNFSLSPTRSFI
jgi:hypothetical protein